MPTIREIMKSGAETLVKAGIENSEFEVQCMASEILKCDYSKLRARFTHTADETFAESLKSMTQRRCYHEPLQYILGNWDFLDFTVKVNQNALIPRYETEDVFSGAEKLINDLIVPKFGKNFSFADIGTGTGVLGIAMARRFSYATGYLADISKPALELAKENAARLIPPSERKISFVLSDLLEKFAPKSLNVIISNPPYIKTSDIPSLMPEVSKYEPILALDGSSNGLALIERLINEAKNALVAGGLLVFEHGHGQQKEILSMFGKEHWEKVEGKKDLSQKERYVAAFLKE